MKKVFVAIAVIALLGFGISAQAVVMETVAVGDAGNAGELSGAGAGGYGPDRICGSVGYNYNIGKYEVTASQYTEFLNAKAKTDDYGLYVTYMGDTSYGYRGCNIQRSGTSGNYSYSVASEWANRPVNYVSYWNACRFANWLGNGQGNGDTETGAYTLNGYSSYDGRTIQRNANWKWAVTSEDEWYKAAYYDPNRLGGAGYWDYATRSNTAPSNVGADGYGDPGNHANYNDWYNSTDHYTLGSPYWRTNVGEFENSGSAYGTFDQSGNVSEWNEALVFDGYPIRGSRGGSFDNTNAAALLASYRTSYDDMYPHLVGNFVGFRVSEVVPAYSINNRAVYDPIMSTASARFNFKVFGKVTILVSGNSFTVDDWSGMPVKVVAPGFSGIGNGDYAYAWGAFSGEGSNRVLNAQASAVVKLH